MNHRRRFPVLALISALVAGPGLLATEEDEVHFCQDDDGKIVLQTDPCPEPIVPEPTPPPAPTTQASRPSSGPAVRSPSPKVRRSTSGWTLIPRTPAASQAPRSALGRQSFPTSLSGVSRPMGPSFTSPELTWRTFVAAVEGDDHAGAGACLTPAALEQLGPDADSIPLADLRSMLERFTRIENGGDLGSFWSIYGVRANQRPKWIFFEQTDTGEWKIAGI
jgi:hypothetical protein